MSEKILEDLERARQEIKRLADALQSEKLKAEIVSEYSDYGVWEYDLASDTCYQYKKLHGKFENNLAPIPHFYQTVVSWGIVHTEDIPLFKRFCDDMKAGKKTVGCDVRVVNDAGENVTWRYEGKTVYDDAGKPVKVIGRTLDTTPRETTSEKKQDSRRDSLTNTYTPDVFRSFIAEKRSGVNRYNSAALMCVGVDDFRGIAVRSGSEYTNTIQKTVAGILVGICAAERDSMVTRVSDGQFLVYIGFSENKSFDDTARKIVSSVRDYLFEGEPVSVSVGISTIQSEKKLEDIFTEASIALAEAVKSGGGCFMYYSMAMSVRLRDDPNDINFEIDTASLSSGTARVYDLIVRAFCSKKERIGLVKEAVKAAGQCLGAAGIFFYVKDGILYERSTVYSSDQYLESVIPSLEINGTEEALLLMFGEESSMHIHSDDIMYDEMRLANGAVFAECRAIRVNEGIDLLFAVVFDSRFELSEQDNQVLNVLENTLVKMLKDNDERTRELVRKHLRTTAISNHRVEGFSIIPGTFVVDDVGDNAADHYDLARGDICYKKMRGFDEPCENCPALQLEQSGTLFASSAYYHEKERRWLDITASVGENIFGEQRYIISSTDITDCLGKIQMTDRLTGLMTFNVFTSEALRLTANYESNKGLFAVVINVAEFNRINEEKGYELGDSILISIADILQRCVREDELLCRSEDSRFAMLLRNNDFHEFEPRLNLIMSSIQRQVYDKLNVHIYLIGGVCDMSEENIGIMGAIDRAITAQKTIRDRLFYNENLVAYYDGVMREKIQERRFIESHMIEALKNNEFRVFYQPKVNIDTGRVVGAEALVRWIQSDGTVVSPGKFVPIFEENGFITEMDFCIYRQAVADIARWQRMNIDVPMISLNVSRRHLGDENFCEKFNALVDGLGVPHNVIDLEITESLLTENLNKLVDVATWFKERGYRISIDDFGSGYSSLNLITMMPFDTLKIDGGFFLRNDLTDKNKKVITSVVSLAKSLNLSTVSEGVETQSQVDFLKGLGCDMIQGFFYYKPMPSSDFEEVISKQNKKA